MTIKLCDCCGQEIDSLCIMSGHKSLSNGNTIPYRPVELCNACFERTYEKIRRYCKKENLERARAGEHSKVFEESEEL